MTQKSENPETSTIMADSSSKDDVIMPKLYTSQIISFETEGDEFELERAPISKMQKALCTSTIVLKKEINLLHGVAIIIGIMIGSGIFVSPVGILKQVKSVGMSLIIWTVTGVYCTLCALCYAELGTSIPESGGEYMYLHRAFGRFPAFLCLWINLFVVCPVTGAATSLILATYVLKPIFPDCDPPVAASRLISAFVICLVIVINCRSVEWVAKVQVVITTSKLIALVIIIVVGLISLAKGNVGSFKNSFEGSDYRAGSLALSFYSGFWAYSGWSYLNFLTDELINPYRNLPRAIMLSMTIVTSIYIITNIAYLCVLSPSQMISSPAVAVTFAGRTMTAAPFVMPLLIAISVFGTINGVCLGMSRLFWKGAHEKQFPSILSMITYKTRTPAPSLILILILTLCYQSSTDIFFLIEMEGFSFSTILTFTLAGLVYLRLREPNLHRPYKVPIFIPVIMSLMSAFITIITVYQQPKESMVVVIMIILGGPVYVIAFLTKRLARVNSFVGSFTRLIQKILLVIPVESEGDLKFD